MGESEKDEAILKALDFEAEDGVDEILDITQVLRRQLAWDTLPHKDMHLLLPEVGLAVGDDGMLELEHAESDERISAIAPILPVLTVMATWISDIVSNAALRPLAMQGSVTPEQRQKFLDQNVAMINAAFRGLVIQLVRHEVVHLNDAVLDEEAGEGE